VKEQGRERREQEISDDRNVKDKDASHINRTRLQEAASDIDAILPGIISKGSIGIDSRHSMARHSISRATDNAVKIGKSWSGSF
jgi:hypothetical protein